MAYNTHTLGNEAVHTPSLHNRIAVFTARFTEGLRKRRARDELARLTDHELHDIGLTRSEIDAAVEGRVRR